MDSIKIIRVLFFCFFVSNVHAVKNKNDEKKHLMKTNAESNNNCGEDLTRVAKKVYDSLSGRYETTNYYYNEYDVQRVLVSQKYRQENGKCYEHLLNLISHSHNKKVGCSKLNQALDQIKADLDEDYNKEWFIALCYCPYVTCNIIKECWCQEY